MFSIIINEDLKLALPQERHAEAAFQLVEANYEHLHAWMPWCNEQMSLETVKDFFNRALRSFAENGSEIAMSIVFQEQIIGGTGFHEINRTDKCAEIGYWLAEDFTGKGIMTKCTRAVIDYGIDELGLNRIVIKCVPENTKSRSIPERLGFVEEGTERDGGWLHTRFVNHVVYSMLARDWKTGGSESETE